MTAPKKIGIEITNQRWRGNSLTIVDVPQSWEQVPTALVPVWITVSDLAKREEWGLPIMAKMLFGDLWQYLQRDDRDGICALLRWTQNQIPAKAGGQVWLFWATRFWFVPCSYAYNGGDWQLQLFKPFRVALPQYAFADCNCLEFRDFTIALGNYIKKQDSNLLPDVLATVMRPTDKPNDQNATPRHPYSVRYKTEWAAHIKAAMPPYLQQAALSVLLANLQILSRIKAYNIIFDDEKTTPNTDAMTPTEQQAYYEQRRAAIDVSAWRKLFNMASAVPGLGNDINALLDKPLHDVLSVFCDHYKQLKSQQLSA